VTLNNGFLLVEVAVVLALLSLLVSLSMPTLQLFDRTVVRAEIEQLVATIHHAQHRALLTGKAQEIIVLGHGYRTGEIMHELAPEVIFGASSDAKGPMHKPEFPITKAVTFAHNTIHCLSDGVSEAGAIYFTNRDRTVSYAISVPVGSSYRNIYCWSDGAWVLI
jgi:type II secretory pathway pseudopilin PulG